MDGGIHAATQGKGNFTQKKLGKNRPQGKKIRFYPLEKVGLKIWRFWGFLDRKNGGKSPPGAAQ